MERTSVLMFGPEGPICLELAVRESTSAPNRLKFAFAAEIPVGANVILPDGTEQAPPDAIIGETMIFGSEFRWEAN
jgi:hypothetical protein